jgi:hypothetical protein
MGRCGCIRCSRSGPEKGRAEMRLVPGYLDNAPSGLAVSMGPRYLNSASEALPPTLFEELPDQHGHYACQIHLSTYGHKGT